VLRCVAVCCSVLQYVAVNVLCKMTRELMYMYCAAVRGSVLQMLQCAAMCCNVLQCVAVCCSVLQYVADTAVCCSELQYAAVCCSVLQCSALCCSEVQ